MAQLDRSTHDPKTGKKTGSIALSGKETPTPGVSAIVADVAGLDNSNENILQERVKQFEIAKTTKLSNAVTAFDAYEAARSTYAKSLVDSDYDEDGGSISHLSPEARKNYDLVGEATVAFQAFLEDGESLDNLISRMEEEKNRRATEVTFNESDREAQLAILQQNFENAVNAWVRNIESLNYKREWTDETYRLREAIEVAREALNQVKLEALEDTEFQTHQTFAEARQELQDAHSSIPDLISGLTDTDSVDKITNNFWEALRTHAQAHNELLAFQRARWGEATKAIIKNDDQHDNILSLKELAEKLELNLGIYVQGEENEKRKEQVEIANELHYLVTKFEIAHDEICSNSETAESEEAWEIGIVLSKTKDNVERYKEHLKTDKIINGVTRIDKAHIDSMNIEQMLRKQRFTPIGDPFFVNGDPRAEYFALRFKQLRDADPAAYTQASKNIGH
jgi:hypothetical protein